MYAAPYALYEEDRNAFGVIELRGPLFIHVRFIYNPLPAPGGGDWICG